MLTVMNSKVPLFQAIQLDQPELDGFSKRYQALVWELMKLKLMPVQ